MIGKFPAITAAFILLGSLSSGGAGGDSGSGPPSIQAAISTQLVPSFSNDLPTGTAQYGPTSGSTASAAPSAGSDPASMSPSVSWICSVYASNPWYAINNGRQSIEGHGFQSCTGSKYWQTALKVKVQKYWHLGIWNTLYSYDSGYTDHAFLERWVWWYCTKGNGWQTYRIVTTGYQGTYQKSVQSAKYLRAECPH